jgi:hypothetical protein
MRASKLWASVVALLVLGGVALPARADTTTFAEFTDLTSTPQLQFAVTQATHSHSSFGTLQTAGNVSIPIKFWFVTGGILGSLPAGTQPFMNAHLSFLVNPQTAGDAQLSSLPGGQTLISQNMGLGEIQITRDGFSGPAANLLTVSFTSTIAGVQGSTVGGITADSITANIVNFSSFYINPFPSPSDNGLSWAIAGMVNGAGKQAKLKTQTANDGHKYMSNWFGTVGGTFSATPEPGTLALAFSALPILGLATLRRRKRA